MSIYLDISGRGGQGGTDDFLIHLDISGVGHDGQGGQRSRAAYGNPSADELEPASAPPVAQPHGFGLLQRWHKPFIAVSLGHSGGTGSSILSVCGDIACPEQPHGEGLPQRPHVEGPPLNFSTTLPRDRPIKYPTIAMSAMPNNINKGDVLLEAILFSIRVFYAGQV